MHFRPSVERRSPVKVCVRKFPDVIGANQAQMQLERGGIRAHVEEQPGGGDLALGVWLLVDEPDAELAKELLSAARSHDVEDEPPDPDTVRCPRCEMDNCHFGKPKIVPVENPLAIHFAYPAWLLAWIFESKRWRCDSCGYAWDDPSAGPKTPTRLPEGMVRPTFRLRRNRVWLGVLVGGAVASLSAKLASAAGDASLRNAFDIVAIAGIVVGAVLGWLSTHDVCSTPDCRERLPPGVTECPRCHRTISGIVRSAAEHFIEAAHVRKDLARLAEEEAEETPPTKARRGAKRRGKSRRAEGGATRSSTQ